MTEETFIELYEEFYDAIASNDKDEALKTLEDISNEDFDMLLVDFIKDYFDTCLQTSVPKDNPKLVELTENVKAYINYDKQKLVDWCAGDDETYAFEDYIDEIEAD